MQGVPDLRLGYRLPAEGGFLPFAEWPMLDGSPIVLDEGVTISRWQPEPVAPTFEKTQAPARYTTFIPTVPEALPPLLPREFFELVRSRLPREGRVVPTPTVDPAFPDLLKAAKEALTTVRGIPLGVNTDAAWATLARDLDLAVRLYALPEEAAFALLRPRTRVPDGDLREAIASAASDGISRAGALRDDILAARAARLALYEQEKQRAAEARARETEPVDFDLAASGLCIFETDDGAPTFLGVQKVYDAGKSRRVFRTLGAPVGDQEIHVPYFDRRDGTPRVCTGRIRSTGLARMTRAEHAGAGVLPDELVGPIRQARMREARAQGGDRRYTVQDFLAGNAKSVEGRHALLALRAHAHQLVYSLANAPPHSEIASYVSSLLLTIAVAYAGEVSLPNVIDAVNQALYDFVQAGARVRVYGRNGTAGDSVQRDAPWPMGLMAPSSVPQATLQALANGAARGAGGRRSASLLRMTNGAYAWSSTRSYGGRSSRG